MKLVMTDLTKVPLVFNVYKPIGKSSFFPVHIFKRNLTYDYGKIGHFGTLDPFAEGVLLVGVQGAQKMNDYVHQYMTKTYVATGIFGKKTTSGDSETEVVAFKDIDSEFQNLTLAELELIIGENFLGEYWQSPHAVSAVKYKGKRLYKLALEGKIITLEKRKRDIKNFEILEFNYPHIKFKIEVSSGTYIRSFFEDIAEFFGGVGILSALVRTKIGEHKIEDALTPEMWPKEKIDFDIARFGMTIDRLYPLNSYHLEEYSAKRYLLGQRCPIHKAQFIEIKNPSSENNFWIYTNGYLLGMGEIEKETERIRVIFNLPTAISQYN